jgi:hypothetical protein
MATSNVYTLLKNCYQAATFEEISSLEYRNTTSVFSVDYCIFVCVCFPASLTNVFFISALDHPCLSLFFGLKRKQRCSSNRSGGVIWLVIILPFFCLCHHAQFLWVEK